MHDIQSAWKCSFILVVIKKQKNEEYSDISLAPL